MSRIGKQLVDGLEPLWIERNVGGELVQKPQKLSAGELSGFLSTQHNNDENQPRLRFNELTLMAELDGLPRWLRKMA